jgi:glutathione S-transferase
MERALNALMTKLEGDLSILNGMTMHGLDLSYFTGKLQAYLRYCEIPFAFQEMTTSSIRAIGKASGMAQMPALELADSRWMTDSTAIISWIDARRDGPPVIPRAPLMRFFSLLMEDYADEWLWRPALHYRWSYEADARLMGTRIAEGMMSDIKLPLWARRNIIIKRQRDKYLAGDGVTAATREHVESIYLNNLNWMQAILQNRPFLLGNRPSVADFGFMGSMFRHFSHDPTPAKIMRDRAPAVYEWAARVWNAKVSALVDKTLFDSVPSDWTPFIADICNQYLPYLKANAEAFAQGESSFGVSLGGVDYRLPVNLTRVHCLRQMQQVFEALHEAETEQANAIAAQAGGTLDLLAETPVSSPFDPADTAPFLSAATAWARDFDPKRKGGLVHDGSGR